MNRVQWQFVQDAMKSLAKLSAWEAGFVSHLNRQGKNYPLSDKQNSTLNNISQKL